MGHVNNANHLTYFELARVKYFDEVVGEEIRWSEQGIILARSEINYVSPILLKDEVLVYSRLSRFGKSSFDVDYRIIRMVDGKEVLAAEGRSVQVCYDYAIGASMPVPASWVEKVKAFEPCFQGG